MAGLRIALLASVVVLTLTSCTTGGAPLELSVDGETVSQENSGSRDRFKPRTEAADSLWLADGAVETFPYLPETDEHEHLHELAEKQLNADPFAADGHRAVAWIYYNETNFKEMADCAARAVVLSPASKINRLCLSLAMYGRGAHQQAFEMASQALVLPPSVNVPQNDCRLYLCRAASALNANRYQASLADADLALKISPDHIYANLLRGEALTGLERNQEALTCFRKSLNYINTKDTAPYTLLKAETLLARAKAYLLLGEKDAARADLEQTLALCRNLLQKTDRKLQSQRQPQTQRQLQLETPPQSQRQLQLETPPQSETQVHPQKQRHSEATNAGTEAENSYTFYLKPNAFYFAGLAARQLGRMKEADALFLEASNLRPNWYLPRVERAAALLSRGQQEEAFRQCRLASLLAPRSALAKSMLALTEQMQGDFGSAFLHAQEALKLNELQPEAWFVLAFANFQDPKTAQALAMTASRLAPANTAGKVAQTWALLADKRPREALSIANQVVDMEPFQPDHYAMRAHCYLQDQKYDQALKDISSARNMLPEATRFKEFMEQIKTQKAKTK